MPGRGPHDPHDPYDQSVTEPPSGRSAEDKWTFGGHRPAVSAHLVRGVGAGEATWAENRIRHTTLRPEERPCFAGAVLCEKLDR